ncbi:MAG: DUF3089 domain-containing protein, partial [Deltaproteobacteria bacterium]|nr:DUF3089 domain-containing protein [Deltaproteobacteria bacterium]
MRRRILRVLAIAAGLLVLAIVLALVFFDALVLWAMRPSEPFDPTTTPSAPDYSQTSAWSARPDIEDLADVALPEDPAIDPAQAPADVFYLHPTSFLGPGWIGSIEDPALAQASDRGGVLIQASAFNACCAVYAPRYRQATFGASSPTRPRASRPWTRPMPMCARHSASSFR